VTYGPRRGARAAPLRRVVKIYRSAFHEKKISKSRGASPGRETHVRWARVPGGPSEEIFRLEARPAARRRRRGRSRFDGRARGRGGTFPRRASAAASKGAATPRKDREHASSGGLLRRRPAPEWKRWSHHTRPQVPGGGDGPPGPRAPASAMETDDGDAPAPGGATGAPSPACAARCSLNGALRARLFLGACRGRGPPSLDLGTAAVRAARTPLAGFIGIHLLRFRRHAPDAKSRLFLLTMNKGYRHAR